MSVEENNSSLVREALVGTSYTTLSTQVFELVSTLLKKDRPYKFSHHTLSLSMGIKLFSDFNSASHNMSHGVTYKQKVESIKTAFHFVTDSLKKVNAKQYLGEHSSFLVWTCASSSDLASCLMDAQSDDENVSYTSILLITAILERSLRNLLFELDGTRPPMLKDILASRTLRDTLGDDVVNILDLFVGPPASVNIRNLLWHGFGCERESLGQFGLFMFFILILIGEELATSQKTVSYPELPNIDISPIEIKHCCLVNASNSDVTWCGVKYEYLVQAQQYAAYQMFDRAVILFLVSFEHIMRVAFCVANGCVERQVTAISDEHFTTLEHILAEFLPEGKKNALYCLLPHPLRTAIFDLLMYPEGLRLRDKLSHMEMCYSSINRKIWNFVYNIVTCTCSLLVRGTIETDVERYICEQYVPVYHPLSTLLDDTVKLSRLLEQDDLVKYSKNSEENFSSFLTLTKRLTGYFACSTDNPKLPSLSMFDCDDGRRNLCLPSVFAEVCEWCKLIQKIVTNITSCFHTMKSFASLRSEQFHSHQLRSRQRKNYMTFIENVHLIICFLKALYEVIVTFLENMPDANQACRVTKSQKTLLKVVENVHSLLVENKWTQAVKFIDESIRGHFCVN